MEEVAIFRLLIIMLMLTMTLAQQATASAAEHCEQHGMTSGTMTEGHHSMPSNAENDGMDCCETECQCPQELCHSAPSLLSQQSKFTHLLRDTPRFVAQVRSPVAVTSSLFRPPILA